MIGPFVVTGECVLAEQVNAFGTLKTIDLSYDMLEGLYLVLVRAEGQAPKMARVVVKR